MPKFKTPLKTYVEVFKSCPQGIAEISLDLDNKTYSYSCVAPTAKGGERVTEEAGITALSWTISNRQKLVLIDSLNAAGFITATLEAIVELLEVNRSDLHLAASKYLKSCPANFFEGKAAKPITLLSFNMAAKELAYEHYSFRQIKQASVEENLLDHHATVNTRLQAFFQHSPQGKAVMLSFEGYQGDYSELILDTEKPAALMGFIDSLILQDEILTLLA